MTVRGAAANGLLLAVGLIGAFALAEVAVRWLESRDWLPGSGGFELFPDVPYQGRFKLSENEILLFDLDPDDPLINGDGFRDRDFSIGRADAVRIMMLGDSVTFGRGVPLEETFAKLLEAQLDAEAVGGRRYEVMNFGVPGYNTRQELEFYRTRGRKYAPDLLVITWVLNDCWPAETLLEEARRVGADRDAPARDPGGPEPAPPPAVEGAPPTLLSRSRLVALVRDRIGRATSARPDSWLPLEQICAVPRNWALVRRSFAEFARLSAQDGVRIAVVIFPMLVDFDSYPYLRLHRRVANEARQRGFPVLDLLDAYRGHDAASLQLLPGDTTHPNALGHRVAAERIRNFLRESGLLGAARARSTPTS